jgi:D-glycero-alpha-D-manno-heptose-7-phosphate kinase
MIISRTPFRVSLFGGGTDYPTWIEQHGGAVLGMAIDKYCYLSVRHLPPFFAHKHRIVYSKIELPNEIAEIQHPSVKAILTEMGAKDGLEIHHFADLPAHSGLGTSSSFTVGLMNALAALEGRSMSPADLCSEAIRIEQEVMREAVGCQDQAWAAHGGLNTIHFERDGQVRVQPIAISAARRQELLDSMILVFSGLSRFSAAVSSQKIKNIGRNEKQLMEMRRTVDVGLGLLRDEKEPISRLGELLDYCWSLKRGLADTVSNDAIDAIYNAAKAAGATGGKVLGAGGGGFLLFMAPPEKKKAVYAALRGLVPMSIGIDEDGSSIVSLVPGEPMQSAKSIRRAILASA